MNNSISNKEIKTADINQISKLLPHAYPFLLIDKIIEMRGDDYAIGVKNVTINEPYFQGHFPGNPIMPGVLQIEGMAQTAAVLCMMASEDLGPTPSVYFMTIDKARFRKPVIPGDIVYYHVTKIRKRNNVWKYKAEGLVTGSVVAEAEISAMVTDKR